jgi:hypothetical protein
MFAAILKHTPVLGRAHGGEFQRWSIRSGPPAGAPPGSLGIRPRKRGPCRELRKTYIGVPAMQVLLAKR